MIRYCMLLSVRYYGVIHRGCQYLLCSMYHARTCLYNLPAKTEGLADRQRAEVEGTNPVVTRRRKAKKPINSTWSIFHQHIIVSVQSNLNNVENSLEDDDSSGEIFDILQLHVAIYICICSIKFGLVVLRYCSGRMWSAWNVIM